MCIVSAAKTNLNLISSGLKEQIDKSTDKSSEKKGVSSDNQNNNDTKIKVESKSTQTSETQQLQRGLSGGAVAEKEVKDPNKANMSGGMVDSFNASNALKKGVTAGIQGTQDMQKDANNFKTKGLQKDEGNKQNQGDLPLERKTRGEAKQNLFGVAGRSNRRAYDEEEEDEGGGNRRRRRPAQLPLNQQKRVTPSIIEGARVGESQTQDMFVSSAITHERITGKVNKSVIEQIKEFSETEISDNIYNIVSANYNHKEKNGIGPNMQKDLFAEMMAYMSDIDDVLTKEYKLLVRDIIQGAMKAGYEAKLEMKDLVKMLVSGFMAMSPHDDDPQIMAEVIKYLVSEIMYGKINIGYNMKSASMWLGAASYTLILYYKNYQNDIEFNRDFEQKLNIAFSENIWKATGEISNYSQVSAKANVEQFMAGRMEEERIHSKNYVKDMVFSPLKKVFNR